MPKSRYNNNNYYNNNNNNNNNNKIITTVIIIYIFPECYDATEVLMTGADNSVDVGFKKKLANYTHQ